MFEVLDGGIAPTRATKYSAMVDLYARESVVIGAGETKIVPLGVKIDREKMPLLIIKNTMIEKQLDGDEQNMLSDEDLKSITENFLYSHYLELHPRSSLRAKGLIIGVGVIDLDFKNELGLIVHNPVTSVKAIFLAEYVNSPLDEKPDDVDINTKPFTINKGDKVAQCTLTEHKGYLLGIESEVERNGGFGSSDK